jgi:alpha,alpha-trehalase
MIEVEKHFQALLAQEDTDGDRRITIRDRGPRRYHLEGHWIEGSYALSNLLQELALAREAGLERIDLNPAALNEPPTQRISRTIRDRCWAGLTRRIDRPSVLEDPKMSQFPVRLYLPTDDLVAQRFYADFEFELLPSNPSPEFLLALNQAPGLLGLAVGEDGPLAYLVPGGRFNEMYGWDSYFIGLGLIHDGHLDLAKNLITHQVYQIRHYGKILNANRSYYLERSQPPFLTRFLVALLEQSSQPLFWIQDVLQAAMDDYQNCWSAPQRMTPTGLTRYCAGGVGLPPETEPGHYDTILAPFAAESGRSIADYEQAYLLRQLVSSELDRYFVHDRTVRESGHDTSYRIEGRAADLCTVDLNSLLYRYEMDLADLLGRYGDLPGYPSSEVWRGRALKRQQLMNQLCWDRSSGQFFDYDFVQGCTTGFESATGLWPLWAGLASSEQAELARKNATIEKGGLAGGSLRSRGELSDTRPARQWDYPYGWAPHQMMAWEGLQRYDLDPSDWAMRWLSMMTRNAVDFNGLIPEKYDVVLGSHEVFAEYGNVGSDFDYITKEGFGWTNASYQIGLRYLTASQRQHLDRFAERS